MAETRWTRHWTARPGYYELNPIWRSAVDYPTAFAATKTALDTGIVLAIARVGKRHPKRALVAALMFAAVKGATVYHNYRVTRH